MAALHSALASLGPETFSNIPVSSKEDLDEYISKLFHDSELIVESVPPPPLPEGTDPKGQPRIPSLRASNASEISLSPDRSAPPNAEYQELQKQWGKPIKLKPQENPLGMSVYKLGGKDGRGAWFARRSVHEGLGFAQWKKALEREFPESMQAGDKPGEGNIRGIGGERKVEDITIDSKGRLEVYQLSAQFPGPTTPRDFITLLITSSTNAMKTSDKDGLGPRYYMIISKPCIHEQCPPRDGYIRGQYESVEFIREVPRKRSSTTPDVESQMLKGGDRRSQTLPLRQENHSSDDLARHYHGHLTSQKLEIDDKASRRRSKTVTARTEPDESESNAVEWIMITRSDPGGSVPRFMVERGTPSSICLDAVKFLNWAISLKDPDTESADEDGSDLQRQKSLPSWDTNGHLAGLDGSNQAIPKTLEDVGREESGMSNSGLLATMAGAVTSSLEIYAPQIVLNYLPGHSPQPSQTQLYGSSTVNREEDEDEDDDNDDAASTLSTVSFASAESHVSSAPSEISRLSNSPQNDQRITRIDKELQKLEERKQALDAKLASKREKATKESVNASTKEIEAAKKAEEKHQKEMQKQEEKYKKEVAKLEAKREREAKKLEDRKKKAEGKDLNKQNETLKKELSALKKERETLLKIVGELQKDNTHLAARLGEVEKLTASSQASVSTTGSNGKDDVSSSRVVSPDISKDAIKQFLEEERASGSRLRGISAASSSGTGSGRSRADSRSKDYEKGDSAGKV